MRNVIHMDPLPDEVDVGVALEDSLGAAWVDMASVDAEVAGAADAAVEASPLSEANARSTVGAHSVAG